MSQINRELMLKCLEEYVKLRVEEVRTSGNPEDTLKVLRGFWFSDIFGKLNDDEREYGMRLKRLIDNVEEEPSVKGKILLVRKEKYERTMKLSERYYQLHENFR